MSLTIRERCQKVAKCLQKEGVKTIRAITSATGLSQSSVSRHKQAIARRDQHPESSWWETEAGGSWLKLLVLGVVYYFGIKQGIGAESLSEFFRAIRLSRHVGCSATALRSLKQKMKGAILAYCLFRALSTICGSGHLRGGIRYLCSLLLEGGDMDGTQETSRYLCSLLLEGGDMAAPRYANGTQETSTKHSLTCQFG